MYTYTSENILRPDSEIPTADTERIASSFGLLRNFILKRNETN